jgi:SOS-response transcriptional repressor LexA
LANLNSIPFDYVGRQKLGGTSAKYFFMKQLPIMLPETYEIQTNWSEGRSLAEWISARVVKLVYTSRELEPFAKSLGYMGNPIVFESALRQELRTELDAAFFHLYRLDRQDVEYILDTFPITKRKDEEKFGEYRTKVLVLKNFDLMGGVQPTAQIIEFPKEAFKRVRPTEGQRYRNCVPIWNLKAAAGGFSSSQEVEELEEWAELNTTKKLKPGMFVAQVVGRSMELSIPDGSWCMFSWPAAGSRNGRVLLVEHHDIHDPETGGSYTVKRYKSTKVSDGEGGWKHVEIRLEPDNKDFEPIVLTPKDEDEVRVVADWVEVLK